MKKSKKCYVFEKIQHIKCVRSFPRGSGDESDNGNRHTIFTYFSPHLRGRINSSGRLLSAALFFLLTKIQHIKNDKKVFLDFIQNHQKKNRKIKKEPTKTGGKK